ncbi:MAG: hypothetical protein M1817_005233 [Caeruleum heppii]|nr:MAG: hypothetical protein M1817_005233 [Caeruleum heppii]
MHLTGLLRSSTVFLLVILALAQDDPDESPAPPDDLEENFDPELGSPDGEITCSGPLPPFDLPRFADWDPNTLTLQELCAKPAYGGKGPGKHLGAFCIHNIGDGVTAFDFSTGAGDVQKAETLANPRLETYCRMRCPCSNLVRSGVTAFPAFMHQVSSVYMNQASLTYQISLDVFDDFDAEPGDHQGHGTAQVISLAYPRSRQRVLEWNLWETGLDVDPGEHSQYVSLDPLNDINCVGSFPEWPAPPGYEWSHWRTLKELCAVQLAGGEGEANAGGYCHRFPQGGSAVAFTDEMTPRLDWTWTYLRVPMAVRSYCFAHCRCATQSPRPLLASIANVWPLLHNVNVVTKKAKGLGLNGGIDVEIRGADGAVTRTLPIVPAADQAGAEIVVGTCGPDKKRFCDEPWPSSILGPTPRGPPQKPSATSIPTGVNPPADPKKDAQPQQCDVKDDKQTCSCGGGCSSISDCSWQAFGHCKCVASSTKTSGGVSRYLGRCAQIVTGWDAGLRKVRRRDAAETRPTDSLLMANVTFDGGTVGLMDVATLQRVPCPCNASYVSFACCASEDGVVYEEREKRLGVVWLGGEDAPPVGS